MAGASRFSARLPAQPSSQDAASSSGEASQAPALLTSTSILLRQASASAQTCAAHADIGEVAGDRVRPLRSEGLANGPAGLDPTRVDDHVGSVAVHGLDDGASDSTGPR